MSEKGLLIVLSGPSGSGKDTILEALFKLDENVVKSVSATTRPPRDGEMDGKDYFFVSREDFRKAISTDEMLEYTTYCENYYGTIRAAVDELRSAGKDVILKIEVDGAMQIKEKCPDSIGIFILPPSMKILADRLSRRGTETACSLEKRLRRATEELKFAAQYDYIVVNDDITACAANIHSIIRAEKSRTIRRENIINEVLLQCKNNQ